MAPVTSGITNYGTTQSKTQLHNHFHLIILTIKLSVRVFISPLKFASVVEQIFLSQRATLTSYIFTFSSILTLPSTVINILTFKLAIRPRYTPARKH